MKKLPLKIRFSLLCSVAFFVMFMAVPAAFAGQRTYDMPSDIDPSARYLFFLHNNYVEKNGPDGACNYYDILETFSNQGFVVISERRSGKIIPCTYSETIVKKVNILLDSGVPPENIIVSGHSKGGVISLCVASQLENPKINFVVMAGCEIAAVKKYKMYPDFRKLKGRMLSIYALSDTIAGSCEIPFSVASQGISNMEIKLKSDSGHQLFFAPDDIWVAPVIEWINKNSQ